MWMIYGLRLEGSHEYRYVGLSRNSPESKLKGHKDTARRYLNDRRPVMNWLRKHPYTVVLDVIEECPAGDIENLKFRECFWIASMLQFGHRLLNLTEGGDGAVLYERTDEWRHNHSQRMLGENNPMYGKNHSANTRQLISKALTGRVISDTHRQNISSASKIQCQGEGNPAAKLTSEDVRKIRSLSHVPTKELAAQFNVTDSSIRNIITRKTWKNLK